MGSHELLRRCRRPFIRRRTWSLELPAALLWICSRCEAAQSFEEAVGQKDMFPGSLDELITAVASSGSEQVWVVMTSTPLRLHRMEPVVDSMLSQTYPGLRLLLSVPEVWSRTGEPYPLLPEWLSSKSVEVVHGGPDHGPGHHLLASLQRITDPLAWIVVIDDDHIYGSQLVEILLRAALAAPGSAVGAQGWLTVPGRDPSRYPSYVVDNGYEAGPILSSYLGNLYRRGYFDGRVFAPEHVSPVCRLHDDLWFSAHLQQKGIPRVVIGAALGAAHMDYFMDPDSLTKGGADGRSNHDRAHACHEALLAAHGADFWRPRDRSIFVTGAAPSQAVVIVAASGVEVDEVYSWHPSAPSLPTFLAHDGRAVVVSRLEGVGGAGAGAGGGDVGVGEVLRLLLRREPRGVRLAILLEAEESKPAGLSSVLSCSALCQVDGFIGGIM